MHSSFYLAYIPEKIVAEERFKFPVGMLMVGCTMSAGIHKYHNLESSDWKDALQAGAECCWTCPSLTRGVASSKMQAMMNRNI